MDERKKTYLLDFMLKKGKARRERIEALMARDLNMTIEDLENTGIGKSGPKTKEPLPAYLNPKNLSLFLLRYNQNPILKYTCHQIDDDDVIRDIKAACNTEEYDYEAHLNLIVETYQQLLKEFDKEKIEVSNNIKAMILAYLTGKNSKGEDVEWSSYKIKANWSSPEVIEWASKHKGKITIPGKNTASAQKDNGCKLSNDIRPNIPGTRIQYFKELVMFFKSLFHIRMDNSLKNILIANSQDLGDDVTISFSENDFRENVELLTDVDKLVQAYRKIIKICKEAQENRNSGESNKEKAIIRLSLYSKREYTYFCIHHLNSVYMKSAKNTVDRIGENQTNLIKNQVNGLCDLFIEADFGGGEYARVNLWDGNPRSITRMKKMEGVKYIMRF